VESNLGPGMCLVIEMVQIQKLANVEYLAVQAGLELSRGLNILNVHHINKELTHLLSCMVYDPYHDRYLRGVIRSDKESSQALYTFLLPSYSTIFPIFSS
jgi:hypothetical protein